MRESLDAYEELKYTALNCGLSEHDLDLLLQYMAVKDLSEKSHIRQSIFRQKNTKYAAPVVVRMLQMNQKARNILEKGMKNFVAKREQEARERYLQFISGLKTSESSKELLCQFLENTSLALLLIPQKPPFEHVSCVALDHSQEAGEYGVIERVERIMKAFREHPYIFYATQGSFTVKLDEPLTRFQIEQSISPTIH